jgi:hypothetical protein
MKLLGHRVCAFEILTYTSKSFSKTTVPKDKYNKHWWVVPILMTYSLSEIKQHTFLMKSHYYSIYQCSLS